MSLRLPAMVACALLAASTPALAQEPVGLPLGADSTTAGEPFFRAGSFPRGLLFLPPEAWRALRRHAPSFRRHPIDAYPPRVVQSYRWTTRQGLSAAVGDFDGDGRRDVVLDGTTDRHDVRLVLMSEPDGAYRVEELFRVERASTAGPLEPGGRDLYLEAAPAGEYEASCTLGGEDPVRRTSHDGFLVLMAGRGAELRHREEEAWRPFCWRCC